MSYLTLKDGGKLYYEEHGAGPETIVMMHGWTSTHEVYARSARILSRKARCIIYDHRGHGRSRTMPNGLPTLETLAGDLDELMRGLSLDRVTLLGWSMGAAVALNYVRIYGCSSLKQLVMCDMTPKLLNDEDWRLGIYQGAYTRADMEREAGTDFYTLYKSFAIGAIPKLKRMPEFLLRRPLKKRISNCDEGMLRSLSASMKSQDNRDVVGEITVPVTYFYAEPGSLFSPALADWYRAHVSTPFQAVGFSKSTHMFVSDAPKQFAAEVGKLL